MQAKTQGLDKENSNSTITEELVLNKLTEQSKQLIMHPTRQTEEDVQDALTESMSQQSKPALMEYQGKEEYMDQVNEEMQDIIFENKRTGKHAIQSASTSHFLTSNRTATQSKNVYNSRAESESGRTQVQPTPHFSQTSQVVAWGNSDSFMKCSSANGFKKQLMNVKLHNGANVIDIAGADEFFVYVHQDAFSDENNVQDRNEVYVRGKLPIPSCASTVRLKLHGHDIVKQVACGADFSYILAERGEHGEQAVYVWGKNSCGQLACSSSLVAQPLKLQLLPKQKIHQVCCGAFHTAMLTKQGELFTCGQNLYGQLGHGEPTKSVNKFEQVKLPGPVVQVALGSYHSLVLCRDQQSENESDITLAFGRNERGQLGLGKNAAQFVAVPTVLNDLKQHKIVSIEACGQTSAALCNLGKLYVWGDGVWGKFQGANRVRGFQFDASISKEQQANLKNKENNIAISKFGLGRDGMIWVESTSQRVYVWGKNQQNQLPFNDQKDRKKPTEITAQLHGAQKIVVGQTYTLCLRKRNDSMVRLDLDIPEVKLLLNNSEETVGSVQQLSAAEIITIDQKSRSSLSRNSARASRSSGSIRPRESKRRALRKSNSNKSCRSRQTRQNKSKSSGSASARQKSNPSAMLQQMNLAYGLRSLQESSLDKRKHSAVEDAAIQIQDQFQDNSPQEGQMPEINLNVVRHEEHDSLLNHKAEVQEESKDAHYQLQPNSNGYTSCLNSSFNQPQNRMNLEAVPADLAPPIHGLTQFVIERRDPSYNHQTFVKEHKKTFYEQRKYGGSRDHSSSYYTSAAQTTNNFDFSNKTRLFDNREAVISPQTSIMQPSVDVSQMHVRHSDPKDDRKLIEESLDRIHNKFKEHHHSREQLHAQTNQVYAVSNRLQDPISRELNLRSDRRHGLFMSKESTAQIYEGTAKSNSQEPMRTRRSMDRQAYSISRSANRVQARINSCEPAGSAARRIANIEHIQRPLHASGEERFAPPPARVNALINESFADTEKQWARAPRHGFEEVKPNDPAVLHASQESRDKWVSELKSEFARSQLSKHKNQAPTITPKVENASLTSPVANSIALQVYQKQNQVQMSKSVERPAINNKSSTDAVSAIANSDPELAAIYKKYENYEVNDYSGTRQTAGQRHQSMVGRLVNLKEKAEEALAYERNLNMDLRKRIENMSQSISQVKDEHRQEIAKKEEVNQTRYQQQQQELKHSKDFIHKLEQQSKVLLGEKEQLRAQLSSKSEVLEHAKQHRDKALKECQAWMNEATRFREDVHYLTEQTNLLIDELQTENNTVKALRSQLADRQNLIEQEQQERQRLAIEKQKLLDKERQIWEEERRELQNEAQIIREQNSKLQMDVTRVTSELSLTKERFTREHQLSQLQQEQLASFSKMKQERDELSSQMNRKQEQISLQEQSLQQLRATINELVSSRASFQMKLEEANQTNICLQKEIESQKGEVAKAHSELQNYKLSLSEVTELNSRLQRRVDQEIVQRAHHQLSSIPSIELNQNSINGNKQLMLPQGSSSRFRADDATERTTIHVSEPDMMIGTTQAGLAQGLRSTLGEFVTLSNNFDQSQQMNAIDCQILNQINLNDSKLEVDRSMQETRQVLNQHENLMKQQRQRSNENSVNTQKFNGEISTKLASQMIAAQTTLLDSHQNSQMNVGLDNFECSTTTYASANKPIQIQSKTMRVDEQKLESQTFNIKPQKVVNTQVQSLSVENIVTDDASLRKQQTNSKLDDLLKKKYTERSKSRHDRIIAEKMAEVERENKEKKEINGNADLDYWRLDTSKKQPEKQRDASMKSTDADDDKITVRASDFVQHTRESKLVRDSLADLKNRLVAMRNNKLNIHSVDEKSI